jgi:hypothetical protein
LNAAWESGISALHGGQDTGDKSGVLVVDPERICRAIDGETEIHFTRDGVDDTKSDQAMIAAPTTSSSTQLRYRWIKFGSPDDYSACHRSRRAHFVSVFRSIWTAWTWFYRALIQLQH